MTVRQELIAKIISIRSEIVNDDRCFAMRATHELEKGSDSLSENDRAIVADFIETLSKKEERILRYV